VNSSCLTPYEKKPITHLDNFELTYRTLVEWQIGAQASTTTAGRAAREKHPVYHHPNPKPHGEQHQHSVSFIRKQDL